MRFSTMKYYLLVVAVVFVACNDEEHIPDVSPIDNMTQDEVEEILEDGNKRLWEEEDHLINMYVQNQQLDVTATGTGIRYQIFEKGDGMEIKEGTAVLVDFTITLINGDTCYTSQITGPEDFIVALDDVESGLHEGIQYFSVGSKGIIIIPYRLAHGLIGDQKKIPALSTIVYHIEVIDAF